MWPDGICRVTDTRYTKTIQYQDINYQLSQNEDKTAIFEAWCDFLNYFDSSVQFQLSFVNLSASQETFARSISIPPCGDEFDGIRAEYAGMLQNQLARGNNGLIKTKYLTFGIEADNLRAAKPRLERIETDLLNNFKRLGVVAAPLNGFERLHVMHDILRMDEQESFRFSWDWLAPSGLSTKLGRILCCLFEQNHESKELSRYIAYNVFTLLFRQKRAYYKITFIAYCSRCSIERF